MMRMMVRGVEGVVTDGGYRDSPSIGELNIPTFHQTPSAPPIMVKHHPADTAARSPAAASRSSPADIIDEPVAEEAVEEPQ
ncbi:regulator of RNase E activity RraA [Neorhizobium galegae]|uniref:RraA family protein n=1 Tax=Neorhizobium galegae TaxID=399 RepID=UPI001AE60D3B|nr:hypothetical protein [Neorhizobium galegae]MBP2562384.1 regulator of RNase E activity RraA [Neorhizobium galegae]MDQ0138149.1 regulator of RNase E activity RraA [Neorhizobium galegae]